MGDIASRLEKARTDLLDLSFRNTLINFRPLRARGVEIEDELSSEVFRILVKEERPMSFLPKDEEETEAFHADDAIEDSEFLTQPDEEESEGLAERHVDNKLQTPHTSARLQRRLLNTFHFARTSIEETGINVLYLALGKLRWFESKASEIERVAPLLLIPVELNRGNVRTRFKVRYTGEDLGSNLSLMEKLKLEFGIELPELPEPEEADVNAFFDRVRLKVEPQSRWSVERDSMSLGFFSFQKYLMYKDLDPKSWPEQKNPTEHPLLSAVLGDMGFEGDPPASIEEAELMIAPDELYQVVDADSSQTRVMLEINSGRNLVVQGPPGTGKSQTITNIIGEAVGHGKKVLFVAEKMAALEVVKRRLEHVHLGDAVLELHSQKARKKTVLEELERVLKQGRPVVGRAEEDARVLRESRTRLDNYCRAVNEEIGTTGVTPYQAYGGLLKLRDAGLNVEELPAIDRSTVSSWTQGEFRERVSTVRELEALLRSVGPVDKNIFYGARIRRLLFTEESELRSLLQHAQTAVVGLRTAAKPLEERLGFPATRTEADVERLLNGLKALTTAPTTQVVISDDTWSQKRSDLDRSLESGRAAKKVRDALDDLLIPDAWEQDVLKIRQDLAAHGTKWWRFLIGDYRRAVAQFRGLYRVDPPASVQLQLRTLDAVLDFRRAARELESREAVLSQLFGEAYEGWSSDWGALKRIREWTDEVRDQLEKGLIPTEIAQALRDLDDTDVLAPDVTKLEEAVASFRDARQALFDRLEIESVPGEMNLEEFEERLGAWISNIGEVHNIIKYNEFLDRLTREGLEGLSPISRSWKEGDTPLTVLVEHARYFGLLEQAQTERPVLQQFDGASHAQIIERFRRLDLKHLENNRAVVAEKHWERVPRHSAGGQIGVLRHEFQKKRRHLPIRQLIAQAGNAIQTIKPVFMMSPLSVATFLPAGSVSFDLVVFDEASQVRPVDALGALLRGDQATVVGDSKQLPPTMFFDRLGAAEDEEVDDALTSDLESVLGLFLSKGALEKMLRWHYRSRHESLIVVSNEEFYNNELIIFPSPERERKRLGLILRLLPQTYYETGTGKRRNPEEAKIVAEAVMRHARENRDLTLGVAAFSISQAQAIQDQLELQRRQDPSNEAFFNDHPEEPFFVKNLENVQGDERDVIFISVGYGKQQSGRVSMNFGPLNKEGGERRLNVLITRARRRCEVFTNLTSDDIDLSKTNARGVVALKRFFKYAETGNLDLPMESDREIDSPFEEAVARELSRSGHIVQSQVGSGGFFIDLAVVDPDKPGRYLLGIECDGATYHSSLSARDRDRLREQVLANLGWQIHRVWSTDWFRNPRREIEKLEARIAEAKRTAERPSERPTPVAKSRDTLERSEETPSANEVSVSVPYEKCELTVSLGDRQLHEVLPSEMALWVRSVVSKEGPVHLQEVARRITEAAGLKRVGGRIFKAVRTGVSEAVREHQVVKKGEFLWDRDREELVVRDRTDLPPASRKIQLIPPEEIEEAVRQVVEASLGILESDVPQPVSRMLGFARLSDDIKGTIDKAVARLVGAGRLRVENHHVFTQ